MITSKEMRELEQTAEEVGIPKELLMENAGRSAFEAITTHFKDAFSDYKFLILCGKGNNGGDGLVVARYLKDHEVKDVTVIMLANPFDMPAEAQSSYQTLYDLYPDCIFPYEEEDEQTGERVTQIIDYEKYDVVIDAMLGIGFKGELLFPYNALVRDINAAVHPFVISLDIPSGMNPDAKKQTSKLMTNADLIITFHDTKPALEVPELKDKIIIADIGIL